MITTEILLKLEQHYGGVVKAPMRKKSPLDQRPNKEIGTAVLVGGDRMAGPNYAKAYAKYLPDHLEVLVELGVFKGTGLAIWCTLFTDAKIVGLDIDPEHFDEEGLREKGAFMWNEPEVHRFDKFQDNSAFYQTLPPIDVMIDDSAHDSESILFAFANVLPFLREGFVYFVEDNAEVEELLRQKYPSFFIERSGGIIVIKQEHLE